MSSVQNLKFHARISEFSASKKPIIHTCDQVYIPLSVQKKRTGLGPHLLAIKNEKIIKKSRAVVRTLRKSIFDSGQVWVRTSCKTKTAFDPMKSVANSDRCASAKKSEDKFAVALRGVSVSRKNTKNLQN
jgi:hypothetical protein